MSVPSEAGSVQDTIPKPMTNRSFDIPPSITGRFKGFGGSTKLSRLGVIARLTQLSNVMGAPSVVNVLNDAPVVSHSESINNSTGRSVGPDSYSHPHISF